MHRLNTTRLAIAAPILFAVAACGSESADAPAPVNPEPLEIAERQDNFKAIGKSFKAIRGQLEGDAPDLAVIEASASDINTRLQRVGDLFPAGSGMDAGFDTEALAKIWEDPDGFAQVSQDAINASAELMAAAASGDVAAVGPQVGNLGMKGCKGCHDVYRVDDG